MGKLPCLLCKNFIELLDDSEEFGKCKAFPDGIPYEHYAFMQDSRVNRSLLHEMDVQYNLIQNSSQYFENY